MRRTISALVLLALAGCTEPGDTVERVLPGVALEKVAAGTYEAWRLTDSTRGVTCYRTSYEAGGYGCVLTPAVRR